MNCRTWLSDMELLSKVTSANGQRLSNHRIGLVFWRTPSDHFVAVIPNATGCVTKKRIASCCLARCVSRNLRGVSPTTITSHFRCFAYVTKPSAKFSQFTKALPRRVKTSSQLFGCPAWRIFCIVSRFGPDLHPLLMWPDRNGHRFATSGPPQWISAMSSNAVWDGPVSFGKPIAIFFRGGQKKLGLFVLLSFTRPDTKTLPRLGWRRRSLVAPSRMRSIIE